MKNEDILILAMERYKVACDADNEEAKYALDDLKFEHNEDNYQWPAEVKQQRESESPPRPCLSLNKISEKIDQVEGEFRQLRPSIKVRPIDSVADPKIAEIRSGIYRHIAYHSVARSAYNTAYSSTLKCGRGAWRVDIEDNEEDPFVRDIVINRIPNIFTVKIDPGAIKQDKSDANWVIVSAELTDKEFKAKHPDVELGNWPDETVDISWSTDKTVRVAEYWWKEKKEKTFYRIEKDGTEYTVSEDKISEEDMPFISNEKKAKVPQVMWCKMIHNNILDGPHLWPSKYIPIVYEIGKETWIGGVSKTKGMVRPAKTPQEMYNYWSSSVTEQIALAPKAPYLITSNMLGPHQKMWEDANIKNVPYLLYESDINSPALYPKREPPPQLSPAVAHELARMEHDIMSAMGIYQASLGDEGSEKSGKAILARQHQGSIGSFVYTDNFQTALIYSTKIVMDLIPHVYDTERIIRIIGADGGEKAVPINMRAQSPLMNQLEGVSDELLSKPRQGVTEYINDLSVGQYDFIITIGPSYDTQRTEALEMLLNLTGKFPEFGKATIDLIVKNIDIPGADELLKRAKKLVPIGIRDLDPGEQPPDPQGPSPEEQMKMKELELKAIEEMRKGFEAKVDAIAKIMNAEAAERGQQFQEIRTFIEDIHREGIQQ